MSSHKFELRYLYGLLWRVFTVVVVVAFVCMLPWHVAATFMAACLPACIAFLSGKWKFMPRVMTAPLPHYQALL